MECWHQKSGNFGNVDTISVRDFEIADLKRLKTSEILTLKILANNVRNRTWIWKSKKSTFLNLAVQHINCIYFLTCPIDSTCWNFVFIKFLIKPWHCFLFVLWPTWQMIIFRMNDWSVGEIKIRDRNTFRLFGKD